MRKKLTAANPSPIITQIACVLSYCLWCLNRFVKFINKNAYIQVALKSDNFCTAAWNSFILILRNAAKFGFVSIVGTIFMYVGKFFISMLVALAAFALTAYWPWMRDQVSTPFVPALVCFILAYTIASIFMSVFSVAATTILQCFILDMEIAKVKHDGGADHQPASLQGFINEIEEDYHGKQIKREQRAKAKYERA